MAGVEFDPAILAGDDEGRAQRIRDLPAERVLQEVVQVIRPADRGRAGRQAILQQQAGRHHEGGELAHGGVGEGIRGTGGRHAVGQLGVAQRGQAGGDRGDQEGQHDRRAGLGHGFDHREEDAGADGGADPDHGQREQPERPAEADTMGLPLVELALGRLGSNQLLAQCLVHGVSSGEAQSLGL